MMYSSEIIRRVEAEMEARRTWDEQEKERRLQETGARDPEILRLFGEGARLFSDLGRRLLQDPEAAMEAREQVKSEAAQARRDMQARLSALGLPEDYLENVWECPLCRDKGHLGVGAGRHRCGCFEKRLLRLTNENGSPLERENFDTFRTDLIPDDPLPDSRMTQRELTLKVRDRCAAYADRYPQNDKPTLLLFGNTGLGKTFLLHCIFARLLDKGADAQMLTSYQAFTAMRACHMGEPDAFTAMVERPVLLLDDLGAEPLMRNVTVEYLFTLLNERVTARRHTVVATNLDDKKLTERYGERLVSRLFDRINGDALTLRGRDLRF